MDPSSSSNRQNTQHTPQQPDTFPPSIQIDEFDESSVRLWKMFREAIQPLYFKILCWVNPGWNPAEDFKDYLESQGVNIIQVKKSLNNNQWDKFINPSSHDTWDITMLHALLPFSKLLAGRNDERWHEQNGSEPELYLTRTKNLRNESAHNPKIDRAICSVIIDRLYELTKKLQKGLKLVVLRDVVNTEDKEEIEREMDRDFDDTRQMINEIGKGGIGAEVFDEYQREIDFTKKKKLLEEEGFPCLKKILEKFKSINPLNLITGTSSNPNIPVEKIYTEMKLEGESGPCSVLIEEILNHVPHDDPSRLLLIKGMAGMGKTTLVKKIISDWLSKRDDIKGLNDFDILLYGECRDSIESFKDLDEMKVSEEAKIEALELLVRSGMNHKYSVLRVLKNIKCDHSSSRWIAQRFMLFDRDTRIKDHTIYAYIALLRTTEAPLSNREEIKITIDLNATDGCEEYRGIWDPTFQIPTNIKGLLVRLKDHPSLDDFCQYLEKTKENRIESIGIRFSVNDVSSVSRPVPFLDKDPSVEVYISDVKEEDIEKVGDILRTLQPQDARRSFMHIYFPLCSLRRTRSPEVILRLLASLKGVRVRYIIWFRKDEQPDDEALRKEMDLKAKESTGCEDGVWWSSLLK
ncbi:uncharacterized protein [Palaemon carinicauda]|uniref:uncharacterized protein n=1 Tax=Palaemon carinicauda TaxID=392227 RepID=UPI0035B6A2CE